MEFVIPHHVTYDFEGRATVPEVAKSLLAQDKLLREAIVVVQLCFPHLRLDDVRVDVREVIQSSPWKTFVQAYVLGAYATPLGEDMPDVLNTLTLGLIDPPDNVDSFVSVITLLLAVWVIDRLKKKMFPGKPGDALLTERERLLVAAAAQASVPRDQMQEAIETVVEKRSGSITKAAIDLISPAKRRKAKAILTGREMISQAAIEEAPSDLDFAQYEPPTQVEEVERAIVRFRAHDLDKGKNWAGTIDEISPQRKPVHLAPHIKPEALFERRAVHADVLVTYIRDAEGDYEPSLYYLQKVHDDEPA